jgi:Na+/H+ antiporter NhaD/arsenite permease-like protein
MRALALTAVFLVAMAWRYRKNEPLWFVIVGSLFAVAAFWSSQYRNDWPLRIFALGWLTCMLIAGVLLIVSLRGKKTVLREDNKAPGAR